MKADLKARKWMHSLERHFNAGLRLNNLHRKSFFSFDVVVVQKPISYYVKPSQSMRMCDHCLANKTHSDTLMYYKNFSSSAAWPCTSITSEMYLQMGRQISCWQVVPGWSLTSSGFDLMHNLFLGTARDLLASSIKVLIQRNVYSHVPTTEPDALLGFLQEEMIQECSLHGPLGCHLFGFYCK